MWESLVNEFMAPRFREEPWRSIVPVGFIGLALVTLGVSLASRTLLLFLDPSARAGGDGARGLGVRVLQGAVAWATTLTLSGALLVFAAAYYEASQRLPATGGLYRNSLERGATTALFVSLLCGGGAIATLAIRDASRLRDAFRRRKG